jgi:hypothetical protein
MQEIIANKEYWLIKKINFKKNSSLYGKVFKKNIPSIKAFTELGYSKKNIDKDLLKFEIKI